MSSARWGTLWAGLLSAAPVRGATEGPVPAAAEERTVASTPDLSRLPLVDDLSPETPPPLPSSPRVPTGYNAAPPMAMPYLGQMLSEPEIDFVPSTPTAGVNPHAVWEGMMVPPPPSARETQARRVRNAGIGLLTIGTALALIAVPTIASASGTPVLQGVGYSALALSACSFGAGGAMFGIGDQRLRAARRSAAGLALLPDGGLGLVWR